MTRRISEIKEIEGLDARSGLIRIPPELDVPMTPRVQAVIDTQEFRRLSRISQLGLVSLVYPSAHHTRFEHSLGVYRIALLFLKHLCCDARFAGTLDAHDAEVLLAAALLHDLGHWPFCHPIEDMRLPGVPSHELFANSFLLEGEIADVLRDEWGIQPREVVAVLSEKPRDRKARLLASMLSGPIDVDKMDYLVRDSLHAGVPYGRNFDQSRLIGSLCLNEQGDGIAITSKGRTAAEMMVFARYVMFSEVYWHHTVRTATAMLQRAFYTLSGQLNLDVLFRQSETEMIHTMVRSAESGPAEELLTGLFGKKRRLYKRLNEYSYFQHPRIYGQLARKPYPWLVACGDELAILLSRELGRRVAPHEILFDSPPVELEVEMKVDVFYEKESRYRTLVDVSPVVRTLAAEQFDDYVKRVRIFAHPRIIEQLRDVDQLDAHVQKAIDKTDD